MVQIGDIVNDRWKVLEKLSDDSGQGDTYLAEDKLFSRPADKSFVIKLLKVQDQTAVARFAKEIKSCISLQHPNIISVVDSEYESTLTPYLVTEYCSGGELTAKKIGKLSLIQRLRMFQAICEAIAHAHSQKVIHRDIKPRNIFFETAQSLTPVVGDFGLCFFKEEDSGMRLTGTREAWGAWEFRPPEADIGRAESCAESADVYMLGKLLYWFLSGGEQLVREYYDRAQFDLRKENVAHVVFASYDVFAKSIVEDPEKRYQTGGEMLEDIKELVRFTERDGRYLDCDLPQSCVFCRIGAYSWKYLGTHPDDQNQWDWYGFRFDRTNVTVVHPLLLIGTCRHCGNIQQFRLDKENKLRGEWKNLPRSPYA